MKFAACFNSLVLVSAKLVLRDCQELSFKSGFRVFQKFLLLLVSLRTIL